MARFIYDVDKITRYIDIHKQFNGGLKTVDTDDALKDIYLREAENVSLSEFNFLEKRYGLHNLKEYAPWVSLSSTSSIVQGYFEYYVDATTVHRIIAIEGNFYIDTGTGFNKINFYGNESIVVNNFASNSLFGTQAPRYIVGSALPSPQPAGQFIQSTNGNVYQSVIVSIDPFTVDWVVVSGGHTFPVTSPGFIQGQYYFDTRTTTYYIWNNVTGFTGTMTAVPPITAIPAEIQSTRPIEGVRLDDKLYIATGTRPIYYKGDGKLYVFPEYEMSDLDIQKRGYNLNSYNIEQDIYGVKTLIKDSSYGPASEINGGVQVGVRSVLVKESVKYPLVPHQFNNGKLTFDLAYHMYQDAVGTYWTLGDNNFSSDVLPGVGWNNSWAKWTLSSGVYTITNKKFELTFHARVLRKPTGTLGSTFYQQVPAKIIFSATTELGASISGSYFTNNFTEYPESLQFGPDALIFPSELVNYPPGGTTSNVINLRGLKIEITDLNAGYFDYLVQFYTTETSYRYAKDFNGDDDRTKLPVKYTEETLTGSVEFENIWVTPEKLEDFNEAPLNTLRVHSCNRVTEHNGRLCFFGNPQHPDYLFFSDIASKEYIPYFYTLQFTNDLQEPVNSVNKFMNILVVQSPSYTWGIKGDSPFPLSELEGQIYQKITINPTIGCIAPHSVKNVRNQLYFLSKEGIFTLRALYAEDNRYNVDPIDRNIYNIVSRDTNAIAAYFDNQYWLNFPTTGETLRYYVDKKAWVKDTYAAWNSFGGVHKYINDSGKLRFITELSQLEGNNSVKIFEIEVDYSLPTDLTKNITSKITTSYLNQNQPFHPKNYKEAKFDFAIQNEYNTSLAELPIIVGSGVETSAYVQFDVSLIDRHFYSITFENTEVTTGASYTVKIDDVIVLHNGTVNDDGFGNLDAIRFMSNKTGVVTVNIAIVNTVTDAETLKLYDSTYDHTVTFNTVVLSEEGTLNIDPIESYTSADVAVPIDLGTRTGNWTFGTSNFGNVIVAVKTVKLSGRGYNSKVSIIEDSKSKWTLESLGITYKVKKARSR
jgi:hypothetical protein